MSAPVSSPQRLTIPEVCVRGFSHWVTSKGGDPHLFAKEYVDRTEKLGYPPDLAECALRFVREGSIG